MQPKNKGQQLRQIEFANCLGLRKCTPGRSADPISNIDQRLRAVIIIFLRSARAICFKLLCFYTLGYMLDHEEKVAREDPKGRTFRVTEKVEKQKETKMPQADSVYGPSKNGES